MVYEGWAYVFAFFNLSVKFIVKLAIYFFIVLSQPLNKIDKTLNQYVVDKEVWIKFYNI
jgi:hypothetical protein